ncbi:uncharacterized protein LOC123660936 [Melitaea cinxia]|uniref:uncharacterized protein LOC123660936 n=1 Tax=Melitaea cinxia TaxID=113334 RepID=UPI001E271F42|nr:uncharacterized protein LOC123660936 [Melitaea cinxia]
MCVNIEVILPTVEKFLILYSLRCGSILILCWTALRTGLCILFYSTIILEVLIGEESLFGAWLVEKKPATDFLYIIYYTVLALLLCETITFVFMIHFTIGLCCYRPDLLQHYLICRFVTWLIEVVALFVLCLAHKLLIGWYLAILFFVILEFYSFIVVYSYYVNLVEENKNVC